MLYKILIDIIYILSDIKNHASICHNIPYLHNITYCILTLAYVYHYRILLHNELRITYGILHTMYYLCRAGYQVNFEH